MKNIFKRRTVEVFVCLFFTFSEDEFPVTDLRMLQASVELLGDTGEQIPGLLLAYPSCLSFYSV